MTATSTNHDNTKSLKKVLQTVWYVRKKKFHGMEDFPKIVHVGWLIRKASDIKRNWEDYLGTSERTYVNEDLNER